MGTRKAPSGTPGTPVGVSGTPSTDTSTCGGMCRGYKPFGVCADLRAEVSHLHSEVARMREMLRRNGFGRHGEPDYMPEDYRPGRRTPT
jgi:hypothetical protein